MGATYITALGALHSGNSINITSVCVGDDGWIYLAGSDYSENPALTVIAYKDGQLAWKRDFHNETNRGAFEAIAYKDGSVYAAGAISANFDREDLISNSTSEVAMPTKAATDQATIDYYKSNPHQLQEPTLPIYVKLNGTSGALEYANVISSPYIQGDDRLRSISVDYEDNVYVGGGGWNHGADFNTSNDNEYYWSARKFSSDGALLWEVDGEPIILNKNTSVPFLTRWGSDVISLNPDNGQDENIYDTGFRSNPNGEGHWVRSWLFDDAGNIYVLAGRMSWDDSEQALDQRGVIAKINGNTHAVEWETEFGANADSCLPNSMTFSPNGSLIIGGEVIGGLSGKPGLGGKDGFLIEVNFSTGFIQSSEIIGSNSNESISQILFQEIYNGSGEVVGFNKIIGGSFEVNRYSLEGTNEKDIYLITDQGFILVGNALDNFMQGGSGDDSISSGDGKDVVTPGSGDDYVDAGGGDDLIVGGDGAGNDRYIGGAGIDTIKYTSAKSGITVNLAATKDHAKSTLSGDEAGIGIDQLSGIENIIAGNFDDLLTGNSEANRIEAGSGNDTLDGSSGTDVLIGGSGNDTYIVDLYKKTSTTLALQDTVTEAASMGTDTLKLRLSSDQKLAAQTFTLAANLENLDASLTSINKINLNGNAAANTLTGNAGDNVIDGGSGSAVDKIDGGAGTDTISYASLTSSGTTGVTLNLGSLQTSGSAKGYALASGLGGADWVKGIENVTGSKYADVLTGNGANNVINGGEGNDVLDAGAGNDSLLGGDGADILIGGLGNDSLNGGTGDDLVDFTDAAAGFVNVDLSKGTASGDGTDTLISIEDVIGSDGADIIVGGTADNELTGGLGNDNLSGGGGSDILYAGTGDDVVDAGDGDDIIIGGDGAGNDKYIGGAGTDTVKYTSATAAITVDLVKGTATSTAGKDAAKIGTDTLSGIENVIAGNYNDIVKGSTGANVLTGGLGSDSLYGGVDKVKDVFDFNAITESKVGTARDKVYDFVTKIDKIDLSGIDANTATAKTGDQGFTFNNTTAKANSVWYKVVDVDGNTATKDIVIYGDVDGNTTADFEIGLVGVTSIASADFVL